MECEPTVVMMSVTGLVEACFSFLPFFVELNILIHKSFI